MTFEDKLALYNDYFSLDYQVKINIEPLSEALSSPTEAEFLDEIPYPFRLAAELNQIDTSAMQSLTHIGSQAKELVDYLQHQSKKIDLMMSYILSMEDEKNQRCYTDTFGAGGIQLTSNNLALSVGQSVKLKLFLTEEGSAVFCYAEVLKKTTPEMDSNIQQYTLVYNHIREEDREILIKAALHQQSKQLRKIAEKRHHDK